MRGAGDASSIQFEGLQSRARRFLEKAVYPEAARGKLASDAHLNGQLLPSISEPAPSNKSPSLQAWPQLRFPRDPGCRKDSCLHFLCQGSEADAGPGSGHVCGGTWSSPGSATSSLWPCRAREERPRLLDRCLRWPLASLGAELQVSPGAAAVRALACCDARGSNDARGSPVLRWPTAWEPLPGRWLRRPTGHFHVCDWPVWALLSQGATKLLTNKTLRTPVLWPWPSFPSITPSAPQAQTARHPLLPYTFCWSAFVNSPCGFTPAPPHTCSCSADCQYEWTLQSRQCLLKQYSTFEAKFKRLLSFDVVGCEIPAYPCNSFGTLLGKELRPTGVLLAVE
ncbi:uncharacterized protein LOC116662588 isoform X2 [Camelus ferus]|uniref:Uncharacterized protein LOC116662588 isoform X2 n=1 Tax=Camelus ferus TaxID=419612 RepID=A0A8B8SPY9_CAMFR|nr:uncharacterized protein LOC116662588 isoform X2 [Camelus ferus]